MSVVLVCRRQNLVGRLEEFFLFGCILDANMIDRKLSEKPIKFELSIGQLRQRLRRRHAGTDYSIYTVSQTSVSETIRKPPLVKAQTALRKPKK